MYTAQTFFNPALARMRMGMQPIGVPGQAIDWQRFASSHEYRYWVLLPVFGRAIGAYAGHLSYNQIDVGLDAIFKWVFNSPYRCVTEEQYDCAATIANDVGTKIYSKEAAEEAIARMASRWRAWAGLL
jgi:hypothetical protein